MTVRVGINGFGRIGRNFFRAIQKQGADVEIVAVNDLGDQTTMAHLLKYDSVLGNLSNDIAAVDGGISIDGNVLKVLSERNPGELPWGDLGVDVVIESTGIFTDRDKAAQHLDAGAPLVIVSAPANGADATIVVGVNHDEFDKDTHKVISNASCTTNCFVPMVQVLDKAFGVEKGLMTTVHAYTGDQSLVDGPHSDLRRARASAVNIIPTSTGAARATGLVLQAMNGKLDGTSLRVPIPDGSMISFACTSRIRARLWTASVAIGICQPSQDRASTPMFCNAMAISPTVICSPAETTTSYSRASCIGEASRVHSTSWFVVPAIADTTTTTSSPSSTDFFTRLATV